MSRQCLQYDPNYNYGNDDEQEQNEEMWDEEAGEGWGDGYDDEVDLGDDDTAWKVRKAAIKIIEGIIISCPVELKDYWVKFIHLLLDRFKERDENVQLEIFGVFQTLVSSGFRQEEDEVSSNQDFDIVLTRMKSSFAEGFTDVMGGKTLKANLVKYGCKSKSQKVKVAAMKTFAVIA
jgi:hypothetical protein